MPRLFLSLLATLGFAYLPCPSLSYSVVTTGTTIELDDVDYYIPGNPIATLSDDSVVSGLRGSVPPAQWLPITVVDGASANGAVALQATLDSFDKSDDVWTESFASAILLLGASTYKSSRLARRGTTADSVVSCMPNQTTTDLPTGPYLLSPFGDIYQPWKLYTDGQGAFTQPVIPSTAANEYSALPGTTAGIDSPGIAVPSRLYYTKTADQPLAGVRFGVKDIYDVAGVRTSNGNRAYYGLYPPRNKTAEAVQRLIDAGAVLVGKMKTSQFANGEVATADWVDYHSSFNPRGDGYQDASSSSTGPGAGAGSYPWLDLTLGSDTGGSIRGPSQAQGLFGNRPTHGSVPLTDVMPLAPELDTGGFLTRYPDVWAAAAQVMYQELGFNYSSPTKLRTIGFPKPGASTGTAVTDQANGILLDWLSKVQNFVGFNATTLNDTALWEQTKPDPNLPSLTGLLNLTYEIIIAKEQTKLLRAPFYADYAAKHDGRTPFIDPSPQIRWAFGDKYPDSELDVAVKNKTIYKTWVETHIFAPATNSSDSCSDGLVFYAQPVNTTYRNTYLSPPKPPLGYSLARIASFGEGPDFVIPIGEASYNSTITNHTEVLPVTVDILAGRGCDGVIYNFVNALVKAGIVSVPQAGQTFQGGEILLRRGD